MGTGGAVFARRGGALVDVLSAKLSHKAGVTIAAEGIDQVDTSAVAAARLGHALVNVDLAVIAREARDARAGVRVRPAWLYVGAGAPVEARVGLALVHVVSAQASLPPAVTLTRVLRVLL